MLPRLLSTARISHCGCSLHRGSSSCKPSSSCKHCTLSTHRIYLHTLYLQIIVQDCGVAVSPGRRDEDGREVQAPGRGHSCWRGGLQGGDTLDIYRKYQSGGVDYRQQLTPEKYLRLSEILSLITSQHGSSVNRGLTFIMSRYLASTIGKQVGRYLMIFWPVQ